MKTGITSGDTEVVRMNWDPGSGEKININFGTFQGHNDVILKYVWFKNNLSYLVMLIYMEELWGQEGHYGIGADDW